MRRVVTTGGERAFPIGLDWEIRPRVAEERRRNVREKGVAAERGVRREEGSWGRERREARGGLRRRRNWRKWRVAILPFSWKREWRRKRQGTEGRKAG